MKIENSKSANEEGMKMEEKSVFSFENNKSLLYFGEISFLEHYQKPTKGAKQNWALDQKSKVPAYWKTIKAQHENPLVHGMYKTELEQYFYQTPSRKPKSGKFPKKLVILEK